MISQDDKQQQQKPRRRLREFLERLRQREKKAGLHDYFIVFFTAALTIVAIGQWRLGCQNATNAEAQFERDERPWVGFQQPTCNGCTIRAEPLQKLGPYHFYQKQYLTIGDLSSVVINTGRTPASNVEVHYTIDLLGRDEPIPTWDSFTNKWAQQVRSHEPEGVARAIDESYANDIRGGSDPQFDLPPTVTHTIHLVQMPTQPYWRDVFGREQLTVYVLGQISYDDAYAQRHHITTLCLMDKNWVDGTSAFTYCPTGNTMK